MRHIVLYSSGIGSWAAAKRVAEQYGTGDLILLFTDTNMEDEDNYRFLHESSENVGGELIILEDGRNPFEVFADIGIMGNSRIDPCSRILKRELADDWIDEHYTPETCRMYVGVDWTEIHRYERMKERKLPWIYEAPMTESPMLSKDQMLDWAKDEGLEPPRMYAMNFPHANCGGFCIRGGQAQFQLLYKQFPERYMEMEQKEQSVYNAIGKQHPFLRKVIDGETYYLTLKEFREQYLEQCQDQIDVFDFGGCGCFVD